MATVADLFVRLGVDTTELTQGFAKAEKTLERFGTQAFFLGSRVSLGIGAPVLAAMGIVDNMGESFDKSMTESLAIMKTVTPQIRDILEKTAFDVAESTKFSADQAAQGYYHLISAGIESADVLKGALPVAARFAQAGLMDMAKSTEFLAGAQAAMSNGLENGTSKVADMARIADVLTEANNRALGTIEDFASALTNKAGAALRQSNKSVEEGVAVLAAYAEQNIKGKVAGQQLWMVIRDLGIYALKNADAFKQHGIAVYDNNGAMRNMADIIEDVEKATAKLSDAQKAQMFNELGIPARSVAATKALLGYSDAIRAHEVALRNAGGATQAVADNQMKAMSNVILQLKHDFEITAIGIFKSFVPTIQDYIIPAVRAGLSAFRDFADFIADLPGPLKVAALAAAGLAVAIGPVITVIGSLSLLTTAAVGGVSQLTGAVGAFAGIVGQAAGGTGTTVAAMGQLGIAAAGATSALGLAGTATQTVVLNQTQLREAMNVAAAAATAGAKAMGMNAVAVADMALEAQIAVANANRLAAGQAAVNEAMAASTAGTGLAARALGILTNPITLVIGGLTLLAGAWYLHKKAEEAAFQSVVDNAEGFRTQTAALEENLATYDRLHPKLMLNTDQSNQLATATDALAKASGLAGSKFFEEINASGQLTDALRTQLAARKELYAEVVRRAQAAEAEAKAVVESIQQQIAAVGTGKGVRTVVGSGGQVFQQPLDYTEQIGKLGELNDQLKKAEDNAKKAHTALLSVTGASSPKWTFPTMNIADMKAWAQMSKQIGVTLPSTDYMTKWGEKLKRDFLDTKPSDAQIAEFNTAWDAMLNPFREKPAAVGGAATAGGPADKLKNQIADMKEQIMGTGGKDLQVMMQAWHQLVSSTGGKIINDPTAVDNLWQAYAKLRGELTNLPPEFEKLFASQIEQQNIAAQVKDGVNSWGVVWTDNMMKVTDGIGQISVAMLDMSKQDVDRFFKEHGSTLEDLLPYYNELEPAVRVLIDRYQQWGASTSEATQALSDNAAKAKNAIGDYAEGAVAKLADARDQLELFSSKYGDREIVALRKGLAQQTVAMDKEHDKQLRNLAAFANTSQKTEFMAQLKIIGDAKAAGEERLRLEQRLGLLRIAEGVGIGDKLLRNEKKMTDDQIKEAIRRQAALNNATKDALSWGQSFGNVGTALKGIGDILGNTGLAKLGEDMGKAAGGMNQLVSGLAMAGKEGATVAEQIQGYTQAAVGMVQTYQAAAGMSSDLGQVATMALAGAQIGTMIMPGMGTLAGAGIGALVGWMMDDPEWEKLQEDVKKMTGTKISEGLAQGLAQAADNLGSRFRATFQHIGEVIQDSGGLSASNLADWTKTLRYGFGMVGSGMIEASDLATGLDQSFGSLVETGTKTSGMLSNNVTDLIALSREYGVASKAVKEYVAQQLGIAAGGFDKLAGGIFGVGIQSDDDATASEEAQVKLNEKIMKLKAQIADYETNGVNNEKQRVALLLARVHLTTAENDLKKEQAKQSAAENMVTSMAGPNGQEQFDRMSRLGAVTADAMGAEGKSLFEILDAIGPALDTMIAAQQTFGFTTNASFEELMKFREFATVNPQIVEQIDGLSDMTAGLSNSVYMTQGAFQDLASQAVDTFNQSTAAGLTTDQAYRAMHIPLQRLWELQRSQNFQLDDATQSLLDQAEASGAVGEKYMSANDKMVEGIGRLNELFEALLKHLGVDIPKSAADAAKELRDQFNNVKPMVTVGFTYEDMTPGSPFGAPGGTPLHPVPDSTVYHPGDAKPPEVPGTPGSGSTDIPRDFPRDSPVESGMVLTAPRAAATSASDYSDGSSSWVMEQGIEGNDGGDINPGKQVIINDGGVKVYVTAPYYVHEQEYISKAITRGVLEAVGGGDEPGYQQAIENIVRGVVEKIGRD